LKNKPSSKQPLFSFLPPQQWFTSMAYIWKSESLQSYGTRVSRVDLFLESL